MRRILVVALVTGVLLISMVGAASAQAHGGITMESIRWGAMIR